MTKLKFIILIITCVLVLWFVIVIALDANKLSGLILNQQNETEYKIVLKGEEYILLYVPKENIQPFFGKAINEFGTSYALVRNDLPARVQRSVAYHEIYHLYDFNNNLHKSRLSQEIHAILASMPYEPLGFLQTVYLTLINKDRRNYYFNF